MRREALMPHDPYKALYLHLPFCVKRCAYCDFATAAVPAGAPEIVTNLSVFSRCF